MERSLAVPMSPFRGLIRATGSIAACALLLISQGARTQELAPPTAGASSGGGSSSAPAATMFGQDGEWVLSVASFNNGTSAFFDKQAGGGYKVFIQPALDYFIGSGVSVGGLLGFIHTEGSTTFDFGARAGFNQAMTERASFWPTVGIVGSYQTGSGSMAELVVLAPVLYHPAPHFFVGAGPFLSYVVKGNSDTEYGLDLVIGGWL
jgi:hypothetical protein